MASMRMGIITQYIPVTEPRGHLSVVAELQNFFLLFSLFSGNFMGGDSAPFKR